MSRYGSLVESMDPTLFATFENASDGERAFASLLDLGIQPEDLSLVVHRFSAGGPAVITDGDELLGRYEPPTSAGLDLTAGYQRKEEEGSYLYESSIGGGISTSEPNDAADKVDEMDDSQSAAEDMSYPANDRSNASQEMLDVAQGAAGSFDTTAPDQPSIGGAARSDSSIEVSAIEVPGLGTVLGDGSLATIATGAAVAASAAGAPPTGIEAYLADAGMPGPQAEEAAECFRRGGAVLTATIRPGDAEAASVEEVLYSSGAGAVRTYADVPEPNG